MGLMIEVQPSAGVALVVGGGTVAARKVRGLLEAGFAVEVVAPELDDAIAGASAVSRVRRAFEPGDVAGKALVFACTNDEQVNALVVGAAHRLGILALAADNPGASTFHSVAVHRAGDLVVGVSTGGGSPTLAVEVRDLIAAAIPGDISARLDDAADERRARRGAKLR